MWTKAFQDEVRSMLRDAAELEAAYGRDTMPRGFLGSTRRCASNTCTLLPTAAVPARSWPRVQGDGEPISMDVGSHGPEEGEELLRDPRHRVPERRRAELGVTAADFGI
jgi:hypothetical protein